MGWRLENMTRFSPGETVPGSGLQEGNLLLAGLFHCFPSVKWHPATAFTFSRGLSLCLPSTLLANWLCSQNCFWRQPLPKDAECGQKISLSCRKIPAHHSTAAGSGGIWVYDSRPSSNSPYSVIIHLFRTFIGLLNSQGFQLAYQHIENPRTPLPSDNNQARPLMPLHHPGPQADWLRQTSSSKQGRALVVSFQLIPISACYTFSLWAVLTSS